MNNPDQRRPLGQPAQQGSQQKPISGQQQRPPAPQQAQKPPMGQQVPSVHGSPASHTQQTTTVKTTETTKEESSIMKIVRSIKQSVQGFTPIQAIVALVLILLIAAVIMTAYMNKGVTRDLVKTSRPPDVFQRIPMEFTFPPTNVTVRFPDGYIAEYSIPKFVLYVDFKRPRPSVSTD